MRVIGNPVLGLMATVLLGGCVTEPPLDYETTVREWQSARESTAACVDNVRQTGIYQRLDERFVLFPGDDQRLQHKLGIEGPLTQQERSDLAAWLPLIKQCRDIRLEAASRVYPKLATVLSEAEQRVDALYAQLLTDLLSVGQFNTQIVQQNQDTIAELKQVEEEINRGFEASGSPFATKAKP